MSKILAIDDKEDNLIVISELLENRIHDCNVITAQSGAEGLKKAKAESPDTILLDIRMPGMDGYEVCKRLKEDGSTRHIPVIMLTAVKIESGDRVSGLEAGADAYLAKPVDESVLIAHVNATLRIKRAEDALRKDRDSLEETVQERTRKLRKSESRYRLLAENVCDVIWTMDVVNLRFTYVSPSVERMRGYSVEEAMSQTLEEVLPPASLEAVMKVYAKEIAAEEMEQNELSRLLTLELEMYCKDGSTVWTEQKITGLRDQDDRLVEILGVTRDISKRKRTEEEKKKLEAQLIQSQKMEAVGTLAGGVAHDFNNILTTIIVNAEMSLMGLGKDNPLHEGIEEIKKAGERAASLTRQLLAFSRKQVLQPVVLNLNTVTNNLEKMLRRLIGEDVELETLLEPDLGEVEADPGQIEQVIMNLAVNARDAMPRGGKLTIVTANVDLDENYFRDHGVRNPPGPYVMLSVSDTGKGMDKETQSRVFEPFFTTKETGKGTGLGLSTVYGIIKQSNGYIWAYSEPGEGTTFKVYLPKVAGEAKPEEKKILPVDEFKGTEIVLIVEDDDILRNLGVKILELRGYRVLEAENGE
ncbi:MAG: response regulator, partial [Deltaproteobacteria bacterium]|nr:response regulator [Deltaproteobacteria bacterium]